MIYTFGRTSAYEKALRDNSKIEKCGKTKDHDGGTVWKTLEQAQAFVDSLPNKHCPEWYAKDFSVYGVDADWNKDVTHSNMPWSTLKVHSLIIELEKKLEIK